MSFYNEAPEPTEEEMQEYQAEQAIMKAPTVRIEGLTAEAVELIVGAAVERIHDVREMARSEVERQLTEAVKESVDSRLETICDELLRDEIRAIVANGWHKTDSYGQRTGKALTLAERVSEYLFGHSYNSPAERIFKEELDRALKSEGGKALTKAIDEMRKMVNEELTGRVNKALREAIGLK